MQLFLWNGKPLKQPAFWCSAKETAYPPERHLGTDRSTLCGRGWMIDNLRPNCRHCLRIETLKNEEADIARAHERQRLAEIYRAKHPPIRHVERPLSSQVRQLFREAGRLNACSYAEGRWWYRGRWPRDMWEDYQS